MAQAVFDEHPLEEYLRGPWNFGSTTNTCLLLLSKDAGESPQILPGISLELEREMDPYHDLFDSAWDEEPLPNWCPQILLEFIQVSTLYNYFLVWIRAAWIIGKPFPLSLALPSHCNQNNANHNFLIISFSSQLFPQSNQVTRPVLLLSGSSTPLSLRLFSRHLFQHPIPTARRVPPVFPESCLIVEGPAWISITQ